MKREREVEAVRQIERQTDGQTGCIEERGEEVRMRKNDVGSDSCLNSPPPLTSHHITSYHINRSNNLMAMNRGECDESKGLNIIITTQYNTI